LNDSTGSIVISGSIETGDNSLGIRIKLYGSSIDSH